MTLANVRENVFRDPALQRMLHGLVIASVRSQFVGPLTYNDNGGEPVFDWKYLLSTASLFSGSDVGSHQDVALRVAQTCLQSQQTTETQRAAAAMILNDLENLPSFELAKRRNLVPGDFESNLQLLMRMRMLRNRLATTVELTDGRQLALTRFQLAFWQTLSNATWISVSAPTSAGKSFVVGRWLIDQINAPNQLAAFVVPTRALISQVEADLRTFAAEAGKKINVTSIPRHESLKSNQPNILVFTQERLHLLLTNEAQGNTSAFSHLIIDEAQKVGDRHRGVMLQLVIEMVLARRALTKVVFVSPMTSNPGAL